MLEMFRLKVVGYNFCFEFLFNVGYWFILWVFNLFYVLFVFYMCFDLVNRVKLVIFESKWGVFDWFN